MNRLFLLGLMTTGLVACSAAPQPAPPPRTAYAPLPGPRTTTTGMPTAPGQVFVAPPPSQAVRDQAALAASCRSDADRIITTRDRGQLMRDDERDARVGTDASIYSRRRETDRLGRIYERDRIAADCVQENTQGASRR